MEVTPIISIIMATYNRAHFIVETLASIQNQTFQNFECLIIDDGGTDNTLEVIAPLLDSDPRFTYHKRSNTYGKGLPGSRNYGLDLAKGEYIIFFDDDDIVHPLNLELCERELNNNNVSFCRYLRDVFTGSFDYNFDLSKEYDSFFIDKKDLGKVLKNELPLNSCAVMWKRECFANNRFNESLMYAEEWELYSRLLSNGIKGISINKCLFYGRKHLNSNTGEFFRNDPIRLASKKAAILLIVKNLTSKKLLSPSLLKYLCGLAISYRDWELAQQILNEAPFPKKEKQGYRLKYYLFPLWRVYYRFKKKFLL